MCDLVVLLVRLAVGIAAGAILGGFVFFLLGASLSVGVLVGAALCALLVVLCGRRR